MLGPVCTYAIMVYFNLAPFVQLRCAITGKVVCSDPARCQQVMDEAEETVALVLDADGSLIGVLTKTSVVEAITASKATDAMQLSQ